MSPPIMDETTYLLILGRQEEEHNEDAVETKDLLPSSRGLTGRRADTSEGAAGEVYIDVTDKGH